MVRRSSDEPRGIAGSLAATRKRDDELARAAGKGSTALRDASGNVLQMNADAPYPLLRPQGVDGSMAFAPDGTVKIISPDTLEDRDMTVRDVASSGRVDGEFVGANQMGANELGVGTVHAARMTAGPTNIDGLGILCPGIGVGGLGSFGRIVSGPVNIDPAGILTPGIGVGGTAAAGRFVSGGMLLDAFRLNVGDVGTNHIGCGVGNFGDLSYVRLVPPPSERALKTHDSDIDPGEALATVRRWCPARWRWADPPTNGTGEVDDGLHAGLYVDEVDDTAPEVTTEHVAGARSYEDRGVLAYVVAALQRVADERDALAMRVAALEQGRRP